MITNRKNTHEKMLSLSIECECFWEPKFEQARSIPISIVLINPDNMSEFVKRRVVLDLFSTKQQIVEMVSHSELTTSLKHWEKNGHYSGLLYVNPSDNCGH